MNKRVDVMLREKRENINVAITDLKKPKVESEILEKWQRIINIMAKIVNVPAGLIMQITEKSMEVLLKSQNQENPYSEKGKDSLGHGLYCETVIGENKELLIDNALEYDDWKDNPDVTLNMIAYYGLPIQWPDQQFFGTICVLDSKKNSFNEHYKDLLKEFKFTIETDLNNLLYKERLAYYSKMDILTSSFNRNEIEKILKDQFETTKKDGNVFALVAMDINKLKEINDTYGHIKGDEIIKVFAQSINSRKRITDNFGRWGGDEFIMVCPNTDIREIKKIFTEISKYVIDDMGESIPNSTFSFGCVEYTKQDSNYLDLLDRADKKLYETKRKYKDN